MRKKWLLVFVLSLGVFMLSGCSEIEDILSKINQILDQQLDELGSDDLNATNVEAEDKGVAAEENNDNEVDEGTSDEIESDGHENEADPMLSFEERLQEAGYTGIDPPNGLRLTLPLDWVLVQVIKEDPWEGVFCFDTQLDETIAKVEEDFRTMGMEVVSEPVTIDSDNVHSTKYFYEDMNEKLEGDIIYFIDNYGTTCGKVYLAIN